MELNPIAIAIPVFFVLIGIEFLVSLTAGPKDNYRFQDAVTNLSCGVSSQVVSLSYKGVLLLGYTLVWNSAALFPELPTWSQWLIAIVGIDFLYYWWHRASHRVNILWAQHIVHHHSQDYNLAVALRQAWFAGPSNMLFMLPLAVLGIHPAIFAINDALNLLYQFWIHTRTIGKLGPLEWFMNTPSHHRVHHGINPKYIDKNYAGVFIVWDRMFGTFVEEDEEPVYGTVNVIESWNPVWANFHYIVHLLREGVQFWLRPPEWTPQGDKVIPDVDPQTYEKWTTEVSTWTTWWVAVQFIPTVVGFTAVLWFSKTLDWGTLAVFGSLIVWATWSYGALMEGRKWAWGNECTRMVATILVCSTLLFA